MIAAVAGFVLKLLTGPMLKGVIAHLDKRTDAETERQRIASEIVRAQVAAEVERRAHQRDIITAGMQHKAFWMPWLIATVPLALWFGWGVLDTMLNGALPDVAELPPQLKAYADQAWANIFFTGAGVAGVSSAAAIIGNAIRRK